MIGARVALAYVHREADHLDAAVEVLAPHLEPALREGQVAITTLGEVELALVDSAHGKDDEAVARILRVRRDRAGRGLSLYLAGVLDAAECRLRLHAGDLDRAGDLLDQLPPGRERRLLTERLEVVAGRIEGVVDRLADLREADADRRRRFEAVALSARAAVDAGDTVTARRLISAIAPVAVRERALRTFIGDGFAVDDPALAAPPGRGTPAGGRSMLVEPLSERELSVLRFLPSRMSNREIGAELYVSLNTVKSHLKAIYRKLDVEGRDDAVRRARQLGLLS